MMIKVHVHDYTLEIHPVAQTDLGATLNVYQQCEDFLALGPVSTASIEMVLKDLEISKAEGGVFCGIYHSGGEMIGVIDYVPSNYKGNPSHAFLELLMIAASFRSQGIGKAVVATVEHEIWKNGQVTVIFSGVQVNNPRAIRFWQGNGYRIISEPKFYPDQTTAVDLRKDLPKEAKR
jgi:ribosomal protein S18 acetylase RimI-like enzyme